MTLLYGALLRYLGAVLVLVSTLLVARVGRRLAPVISFVGLATQSDNLKFELGVVLVSFYNFT